MAKKYFPITWFFLWAAFGPASLSLADSLRADAPQPSLQPPVYHWVKSCNDDGLVCYWSKVENSPIIAFKGEGIVDAPIEKVASVIIDTTRGTEWIDSLVESKVVRSISPAEFIEYDHVGIPFPFDSIMSDRDFVSRVAVEADSSTRRITVRYLPTEDELAPLVKNHTRGIMACVFKLVPMSLPEETYVEAEVDCDPKGAIPPWIANFFQQGWPQTTFQALRKQVQKNNIQVLPLVEKLLQAPPVAPAAKPRHKRSSI